MNSIPLKNLILSPKESRELAELLAQKEVLRIMKTCLMINY